MDSSLRALAASAGVAVRLGYRAAPRRTVLLQVTTALLALGPVLAALALRALVDALTARQLGPAVTAAVLGAVVGLVSTALQLTNAYLRESLAAALNEATEAELATRRAEVDAATADGAE